MSATATGRWLTLGAQLEEAAGELATSSAHLARVTEDVEALCSELVLLRERRCPTPRRLAVVRSGRVLLVEDDDDDAALAESALAGVGYTVVRVATGEDACARLPEQWAALVVDLTLGSGCTGLSVARQARSRAPGVRVVLWSATRAVLEQAQRVAGAVGAVWKGDGVEALIAAVCGVEVARDS